MERKRQYLKNNNDDVRCVDKKNFKKCHVTKTFVSVFFLFLLFFKVFVFTTLCPCFIIVFLSFIRCCKERTYPRNAHLIRPIRIDLGINLYTLNINWYICYLLTCFMNHELKKKKNYRKNYLKYTQKKKKTKELYIYYVGLYPPFSYNILNRSDLVLDLYRTRYT